MVGLLHSSPTPQFISPTSGRVEENCQYAAKRLLGCPKNIDPSYSHPESLMQWVWGRPWNLHFNKLPKWLWGRRSLGPYFSSTASECAPKQRWFRFGIEGSLLFFPPVIDACSLGKKSHKPNLIFERCFLFKTTCTCRFGGCLANQDFSASALLAFEAG